MQLSTKFLIVALLVANVSASLHEAQPHLRLVRRAQPPTDAASAAKLKDSDQPPDCLSYNDQAVSTLLKQKKLPKPSQIASIQDGDDEAQQVWKEIQDSGIIPKNVKQKQAQTGQGGETNMGVEQGGYDANSDPDCWWTAGKCTTPKHKHKGMMPDLYKCDEPDTYGLTFDDGPHCAHNELYDLLKNEKLKATMFYIGTNVANFPFQAQRGIADGHDLCVHTWAHRYMTTLTDEQVFAELFYTARAIKYVTGVTPSCWRPPFGDVDDRVRGIASGLGLRTILWEEDTNDWKIGDGATKPQVEDNYKKIAGMAGQKSPIVLAHELNPDTMKMFVKMEPTIKKAYKNVVPLTACLNVTKPYVEDITYPDFSEFTSGNIDAKGLPSIDSIKTDPNSDYKAVSLDQMKEGFAHIGQSKGGNSNGGSGSSDGNGGSSNNNDASSSDSGNGNNAAFNDMAHAKAGMAAGIVAATLGMAVSMF